MKIAIFLSLVSLSVSATTVKLNKVLQSFYPNMALSQSAEEISVNLWCNGAAPKTVLINTQVSAVRDFDFSIWGKLQNGSESTVMATCAFGSIRGTAPVSSKEINNETLAGNLVCMTKEGRITMTGDLKVAYHNIYTIGAPEKGGKYLIPTFETVVDKKTGKSLEVFHLVFCDTYNFKTFPKGYTGK